MSSTCTPKGPETLIGRKDLAEAVDRLAGEIRRDLNCLNPIMIGILKGSFVFFADLIRALRMPLEVEFVILSSYGAGTDSSGEVRVAAGISREVEGRHVVVVEDIVDTGITLTSFLQSLRAKNPASVRLCALLDKPDRRLVHVPIDYLGFTVPNKFIVGYGIDWNEKYRYLPDVCYIETPSN